MLRRPCVVLLPGLLCDATVWSEQYEALSFVDCFIPDYGELSSITDMAHYVLETVPTQHFTVAGHSMGGRVALEIARLAPERIEKLALLDTGMDPLAPGEAGERERTKRMALLQLAHQQGMRAMGQQWAQGMVHTSRWNSPVFEAILDMIERQTPAIFEAQLQALLDRPDARGVLRSLHCPTLLICGRQDVWSPLARHEQMKTLIPDARLVVVEECGHMSTMEQPRVVSQILMEWVQHGG